MSGKLEGIGARLQNDFTEKFQNSFQGSSLAGKQLEAGDLVMKVAQGNELAVDVVGCVLMMLKD
jgi:carboxyl-terminal processing protease